MSQILINQINTSDIPKAEKSRLIREVLSGKPVSLPSSSGILVEVVPSAVDIIPNDLCLTCEHYPVKKCSRFKYSCCGTIDPCNWCHRERRGCKAPAISTIMCNECNTEQSPAAQCANCHVQFAKSYCDICQLWSDKDIWHCNDCGICRVGKEGEVLHCHACDCCYPADIISTHFCGKKSAREVVCPICNESAFATQKITCVLPCNHMVHHHCLTDAMKKGHYRCPLCRKCMGDMSATWAEMRYSIEQQPLGPAHLPPIQVGDTVDVITAGGEFLVRSIEPDRVNPCSGLDVCYGIWTQANGNTMEMNFLLRCLRKKSTVDVQCFDCEVRSQTLFHYIGLECQNCGSFNTTRL